MDELPLWIATRNGSCVATLSVHCWQSTAHTVGSGSLAIGIGAGLCMVPAKVSTGCPADRGIPFATGCGGVGLTGGSASAGRVAAPTTAAASSARGQVRIGAPYRRYVMLTHGMVPLSAITPQGRSRTRRYDVARRRPAGQDTKEGLLKAALDVF